MRLNVSSCFRERCAATVRTHSPRDSSITGPTSIGIMADSDTLSIMRLRWGSHFGIRVRC